MASPRRQQRKLRPWRRSRRPSNVPTTIPWGWMCLTGILYMATGMVMAAFPAPYWIWNLALGGAIAQALALAGPQALRHFRYWSANSLVFLAILGTGAIVVALATALGFVGTDQLDEIKLTATTFQVIRVSFLAIVIAALGAIVGAETGDRLLRTFNRLQTTLVLAATCILGLGLGGLIGLLVSE
ncbi:hypothetical protein PN498_04230 [Oscillatoria sp. CS-180]|uniref:hypothetical protein n=1 Tax=Oscillatoria sp. CS-180 TaxID=3021720 RepID=UPI00232F0B73|nr:hypothetical protein [Oscillatoria sp. CS-180]MDB9525183.1 hypothetical protein [Oscillatoria sp. CS-180]